MKLPPSILPGRYLLSKTEWKSELLAVSDEHDKAFMEPLRCVRPIARFGDVTLAHLVRAYELVSGCACAFFTLMLASINILIVIKVRVQT